ncbi:hypothetical protein ON010_g18350 [Phytophthora cinnamomi]|nr:hypothetical protein ON010_g18350 [Phytophthora cinnamomi]
MNVLGRLSPLEAHSTTNVPKSGRRLLAPPFSSHRRGAFCPVESQDRNANYSLAAGAVVFSIKALAYTYDHLGPVRLVSKIRSVPAFSTAASCHENVGACVEVLGDFPTRPPPYGLIVQLRAAIFALALLLLSKFHSTGSPNTQTVTTASSTSTTIPATTATTRSSFTTPTPTSSTGSSVSGDDCGSLDVAGSEEDVDCGSLDFSGSDKDESSRSRR